MYRIQAYYICMSLFPHLVFTTNLRPPPPPLPPSHALPLFLVLSLLILLIYTPLSLFIPLSHPLPGNTLVPFPLSPLYPFTIRLSPPLVPFFSLCRSHSLFYSAPPIHIIFSQLPPHFCPSLSLSPPFL